MKFPSPLAGSERKSTHVKVLFTAATAPPDDCGEYDHWLHEPISWPLAVVLITCSLVPFR